MTTVSYIMECLLDKIRETTTLEPLLVSGVPATFEIGKAYVVSPEQVTVEHCIGSGSIQDFDVDIVIPIQEFNSDYIETVGQGIQSGYEIVNMLMESTFHRLKIVGEGQVYNTDYDINQWEANGFIYTVATVTLSITSILNV